MKTAINGSVDPSELIDLKTIDGNSIRVLRSRFNDVNFKLLSCYTKQGKRKPCPIHRSNLMAIDESNATESYKLEKELRAKNKVAITDSPRSAKRERELYAEGFFPVRKNEFGVLERCSLGLVWIKPNSGLSLESIHL